MGTKQKVSSIKENLHKLYKQLEKIQKDCPHKIMSMKFLNTQMGVRWVCEECQKPAKIPTPQEITTWANK